MGMFDQPRGMFAVDTQDTSSLGGLLSDYLRSVMSGQIAANGVLGQNNYDPNRSFAQNALDPKAIENATNIGLAMGVNPIKAYHASPYDFDRFDLSKVGTGQGAQSYGYGIYASENPAVSGPKGTYDLEFTAKNLGKPDLNQGEALILRMLRDKSTDMDVIGELAKNGYTFDEALAALNNVKAAKAKIYEVNINADPDAFLNWDKPLSEQPAAQKALEGNAAKYALTSDTPAGVMLDRAKANPYYAADLFNRGGEPVSLTPDQISQRLHEAGIPGIRYLDQGSRSAGQGSSNYVVFDPSIIEILRKYGIFGPVAAPGALAPFMGDQQQ